jgi:anaerobic ribonucleoside-triphosphate reductase activating protein
MYYGAIKTCDIANGPGVRVSLFVSGCTNRCKGCFQPETWDFCYGQKYTAETEQYLIQALNRPGRSGLTVLGGEPFEPENQKEIVQLLKKVKNIYPEKDIWCYTGFTYEQLIDCDFHKHCEVTDEMLSLIDVLVDGRFEEELKDLRLPYRGSANQRILNLREMRLSNHTIND